ncbi:MAG: hypothetical protein H0V97_11005 [Actinobacteria bacterium]|nr:hypothetical protein [Actinomycetota bacterium]
MGSWRNERGVVLDWLTRVALVLAFFAVIIFDSASVMVNSLGLSSTADDIAAAVSTDTIGTSVGTPAEVVEEAEALAAEAGARLVKAELDTQGVIHIKLRRTANTLVAGRIGALERWVRATASGRASTDPS